MLCCWWRCASLHCNCSCMFWNVLTACRRTHWTLVIHTTAAKYLSLYPVSFSALIFNVDKWKFGALYWVFGSRKFCFHFNKSTRLYMFKDWYGCYKPVFNLKMFNLCSGVGILSKSFWFLFVISLCILEKSPTFPHCQNPYDLSLTVKMFA